LLILMTGHPRAYKKLKSYPTLAAKTKRAEGGAPGF
jgi:hypothetical protein